MIFATLHHDGIDRVVIVDPAQGTAFPIMGLAPGATMLDLIETGTALDAKRDTAAEFSLESAQFRPPIFPPRNIMCVGKNYREHAQEFTSSGFDSSARGASDAIPEAPIVFTKAPQTVVAHGDDVPYPHGLSDAIDYEAELGVILAKGGRRIAREDALSHVFGYTIINDVTARDLQSHHRQWFIGKSMDGFCPIGPVIVTRDELDETNLEISCRINGELRQHANTRDLIFDIPTLIETLSAGLTLIPGDVIATGTPAGVGIGFKPPRYLKPGDEMSVEIQGIGRLTNTLT